MTSNVVPLARDSGQKPRLPPHNAMAEQAVLGAILANNKAFDQVEAFLLPDHFYDPLHARLYTELGKRIISGKTANLVTMRHWIEADQADDARGLQYLTELVQARIGQEIRTYGEQIFDTWVRRVVAERAKDLYRATFDPNIEIQKEIASHLDLIDATAVGDSTAGGCTFDDAMKKAITRARQAKARGGRPDVYVSTFPRLMSCVPLMNEELTILGGQPGEGKSALAWGWAIDIARDMRDQLDKGTPLSMVGGIVGISLEMSDAALATRALSACAGIPANKISRGQLSEAEFERLDDAQRELANLPIYLIAVGGLSPSKIRMRIRQVRRRFAGRIKLGIIDHAQLVDPDDIHAKSGGAWATGKVADALLNLCKEFKTHVIALSQLDIKDIAKRQDKRPTKADLRWSANFAQNADNILFIHRPEEHLPKGDPTQELNEPPDKYAERCEKLRELRDKYAGKGEIILEKIRGGRHGVTVHVLFDGPTTSFSEDPTYESAV